MNHPDIAWLTSRPVAHRGLHDSSKGIIENCTQAFTAAIEQNFPIELDLQITADGKAAVFHDYTLDRLTKGTGRVDEHTMADLAKVDFKGGTDHIIEFRELLELVAGKVPLVVELKTPKLQDGTLEKIAAEAVKDYEGKVALMSFSPMVVENLIPLTDRPRGIISCDHTKDEDSAELSADEKYTLTHMLHAPQSQFDFVSFGQSDFPSGSLDLLKAIYKIPVICWTTRSVESHNRALNYCDQVTFEGYNPDDLS